MVEHLDTIRGTSNKGAVVALQELRRSGRLRASESSVGFHALVDQDNARGVRVSRLELEDGVRTLLETNLDSFEKLEIVRALRAHGAAMSRSELEDACGLSSELVDDALPSLERSKLVERGAANQRIGLGIASKDPRLATLMQLYDEDRSGVLAALSSLLMQRIRSMAVRAFADAFVIRKKRDDDG